MRRSHQLSWVWSAWLVCSLGASGCNLVLGIKSLKGPKSDSGVDKDAAAGNESGNAGKGAAGAKGAAGNKGAAGDKGGVGGANSTAGRTGGAGASAGGAGAGGAGNSMDGSVGGMQGGAGSSVDAGVDSGSVHDAGTDSGNSGGPITVEGKIIDFWRHPIPNVPVSIGAGTATTDSTGTFMIGNVTTPYNVTFTISTIRNNSPAKYAWRFEGLTRADPTLQVYRGLADRDANHFNPHVVLTNATFPLTSSQKILMDFASPDGEINLDLDSMDTDYVSASWVGPQMTTGAAHALFWTFGGTHSLPTGYLAHDSHSIVLDEVASSNPINFNLDATTPIATGTVSGTVTSATTTERTNQVYVHFNDNAVIKVADEGSAPASFSYVVPTAIANASMMVAASEGNSSFLPFAVAYQDNVAAGQSGIALDIPAASGLVAPGAGASAIDGSTTFAWTSGEHVFLLTARADATFDAYVVVTANKQTTLPVYPESGLALAGNALYIWSIETHGSYASVDEACGSAGLLSSFSYGELRGPRTGAGSYTGSVERNFMSKP